MRLRIVHRKIDNGEIEQKFVNVSPFFFKAANTAYCKLLISNQEVEVKKGRPAIIKIKEITLPPKTAISPLSILRHGLGLIFDVYGDKIYRVEEEKKIKAVAFLPIEDGKVEIDDLLGVIKVYLMNVATEGNVSAITPPDVKISVKRMEANLVYRKGGQMCRERKTVEDYWYKRWNIAEVYPVISEEEKEVRKGKVEIIRIKNFEIPENTIPVPKAGMIHALGSVLDIMHYGRPKMIEERKWITHAIFLPLFDGKIEKGDLIGVLNVYYVSAGERVIRLLQNLLKETEVNQVFWRSGKIERKRISFIPLSFRRSNIGRIIPVIADEDAEIKDGEAKIVKIVDLELPASTIVQQLTSFNHAGGSIVDITSLSPPRRVEEDRVYTSAVFLSSKSEKIQKGDLIGAVAVYNVSVLLEPEILVSKYRNMLTSR